MPEALEGTGAVAVLRCAECGALDPGPRELCPACHARAMRPERVDGAGRLVTFTTIRRPPTAFRADGPYIVAVVDLDAGVRVTGRLVAGDGGPAPGARVRAVADRAGVAIFEEDGA
jgi:hypothetical protein